MNYVGSASMVEPRIRTHQQACPYIVVLGLWDLEGLLKALLVVLRRDEILAIGWRLLIVLGGVVGLLLLIWLLIWLFILLLILLIVMRRRSVGWRRM